jgi:hypothetical protein
LVPFGSTQTGPVSGGAGTGGQSQPHRWREWRAHLVGRDEAEYQRIGGGATGGAAAGSATGGNARVIVDAGELRITAPLTVRADSFGGAANAQGSFNANTQPGGNAQGGNAQLIVNGGLARISNASITAGATGG